MTPDDSSTQPAAPEPAIDYAGMMPLLYDELMAIAAHKLRGEKHQTIAPADLVHEAFLKLATGRPRLLTDKVHVRALMATAMRQVLIDRARERKSLKRGGDPLRVTLSEALPARERHEDALELEMAVERLNAEDPRAARAFVLSQYGGLTYPEIALHLEVSERLVQEDMTHARAWLKARLTGDDIRTGPPEGR